MKLSIALFAIILLFACIGGCSKHDSLPATPVIQDTLLNWQKITGPSKDAEDIWFVNPSRGFICDSSSIYSSSDSGKTWLKTPGVSGSFVFLYFLDAQRGAAVGYTDLYITTNGGLDWTKKPLPAITGKSTLVNIQFTSASTVYLSTPDAMYKSTDTCNSWSNIFPNPVSGMYFINDNEGFLFQLSGTNLSSHISKTTDGGTHWLPLSNTSVLFTNGYNTMQFTDRMHGWLTQGNVLFGSTDGAATWLPKAYAPEGGNYFDVQFLDNQTGYVTIGTEIQKTTDGGQIWSRSCKVANKAIFGIFFINTNTGWACCSDGTILRLKQ